MVATYYVDSSAIVKLAVPEAETKALRSALGAQRSQPASSEIALVEVRRAVARRAGGATDAVDELLAGLDLVPLAGPILEAASRLGPPELGTLDAIHIASALVLGSACDGVITYDARMAEAARAAGIAVFAPGPEG